MTADQFKSWLASMKEAGLSRSDADCARQLNRTPRQILLYKRHGADGMVALACSALMAGLRPWGASDV
jgi:hypothetical protein